VSIFSSFLSVEQGCGEVIMLDDNNLFHRAASSAYASMAAFTAAANMYNSFYPTTNSDPVNYFGCPGKTIDEKKKRSLYFIL
jgi:hypothetical protein